METFIATCPYCGQAQTVMAESKVEAEDKIIALCMCNADGIVLLSRKCTVEEGADA